MFELQDEIASVVRALREGSLSAAGGWRVSGRSLCARPLRSPSSGARWCRPGLSAVKPGAFIKRGSADREAFHPRLSEIGPEDLGKGQSVKVRIVGSAVSLANDMAQTMVDCIRQARRRTQRHADRSRRTRRSVPRAGTAGERRASILEGYGVHQYGRILDRGGRVVPLDHPLSFRAYMNRQFYDLLDEKYAPPPEHRVFPDPQDPEAIGRRSSNGVVWMPVSAASASTATSRSTNRLSRAYPALSKSSPPCRRVCSMWPAKPERSTLSLSAASYP